LLAVALAACATKPQPRPGDLLPPGWHLDAETRELVHVSSGFHFAEWLEECVRGMPHDYDAAGENVSVGYDCPDTPWLTIYVYPNSFGGAPDPQDHFDLVLHDVVAMSPTAQLKWRTPSDLKLGSRTMPGFEARLDWLDSYGSFGSLALLIPDGDRFVKVRASARLDGSDTRFARARELAHLVLERAAEGAEGGTTADAR
jgi:hypothetical protein